MAAKLSAVEPSPAKAAVDDARLDGGAFHG
jgi:hypothetical protein